MKEPNKKKQIEIFTNLAISLIFILVILLSSCKFLQTQNAQKSDLGYRFRLTKDSTVIGAWGDHYLDRMPTKLIPNMGFWMVVITCKDSVLDIPCRPRLYDSTSVDSLTELEYLQWFLGPPRDVWYDFTIESPNQITRYEKPMPYNDRLIYSTSAIEFQIDDKGNLLINSKGWNEEGGGDTTRELIYKLPPYKFKHIKINE
jgi:hypothetical protein